METMQSQANKNAARGASSLQANILSVVLWGLVGIMVLMLGGAAYWRLSVAGVLSSQPVSAQAEGSPLAAAVVTAPMPDYAPQQDATLLRALNPRTIIPDQNSTKPQTYQIEKGDSIFAIAKKFNIKPETILWANSAVLNDDPHMISPGMDVIIPPVDGIYYKWKANDTLEKVAAQFRADPQSILTWPGNKLDVTKPDIKPDSYVMIPGGSRELKPWVVPSFARGKNGTNKTIAGPGACDTGDGGAFGSGSFGWPAGNHYLSGNDFWSGHQAIDIAAGQGAAVYATDSGVVVYAGPIGGGYGNMIMIDHGNGYSSLYAHLSAIGVGCGSSVARGQTIGASGSTGNSTGAHLHFEIRYYGAFINPWQVLP